MSARSIAVVGASDDVHKPGGRCLHYLSTYGFDGDVFPINPNKSMVQGLRAYRQLEDVGRPIDLVVSMIGINDVEELVRRSIACHVRGIVVCATGALTAATMTMIERSREQGEGISLAGPNSLDILKVSGGLAATFNSGLLDLAELEAGPVAIVSQSGAIGASLLTLLVRSDCGVHSFVSTGSEADLTFEDYCEVIRDDLSARYLVGYVEGLRDGHRMLEIAQQLNSTGRHVILQKVGSSAAGATAAQSHTGAITGSGDVFRAAMRRAGILEAASPANAVELVRSIESVGRGFGRRVAIISMSGGGGVMLADACQAFGLDVAELGSDTLEIIGSVLFDEVEAANPVDLGGVQSDMRALVTCVDALAADGNVDAVVVFASLSPQLHPRLADALIARPERGKKPVFVVWLAGPSDVLEYLWHGGIPAFSDPAGAVRVISQLSELVRATGADLDAAPRPSLDSLSIGGSEPDESAARHLLRALNVSSMPECVITSLREAQDFEKTARGLYAVKLLDAQVAHKSDIGGVALDVEATEVAEAYRRVTESAERALGRPSPRALVTPMAETGLDLLVGVTMDSQFGAVVTVGHGGIHTELLADTVCDLAPVSIERARSMLSDLRVSPILSGYRGSPALDVDAAAKAISSMSSALVGPIVELEVNPLRVLPAGLGCVALDAFVRTTVDGREQAL